MDIPGYRIGELISESRRSMVYRGRSPSGESVVIKIPAAATPSPGQIARFQLAYDMGIGADPDAVVRHLDLVRFQSSVALVTEDFQGVTLSSLIPVNGFRIGPLIDTALALANALARLHASGILHKDVNPDNILVGAKCGNIRFIGLGAATRFSHKITTARSLEQIEGTLAYTSPEQCGRVDSPVDDRSDLYSLGVTLFQLATGKMPFEQQDPVAIAHAHIALAPPKVVDARNDIPAVFSDIVDRLLKKNADDRYASAAGLVHDLQRCATEYHRTGTVRGFAIAEQDISFIFRIPERLYGREAQCDQFLRAFECARRGERTLVTVAGLSGVGKTVFVSAMQRPIVSQGGMFFSGKFDQYKHDQPYLGIVQAGRKMLRRELSEPEQALQVRRHALEEAAGISGRLLTDVMPELEMIIGPQPEVHEVAPLDAMRRFHGLFTRFLRVFATAQSPLVLFIDDLQWADPASLTLLEALASSHDLDHLVFVLGFRSNELVSGHPALPTLAKLRESAKRNFAIELEALEPEHITAIVMDTLHSNSDDVRTLGNRIHEVAAGNVFFAREYLLALHERGFFSFDKTRRLWSWDLAALPDQSMPDNVVDLLTYRLAEMPNDCLDLLDTASCIGSEFDLRTISSIHEIKQSEVAVRLAPAVNGGLLVPLGTEHKTFESLADWDLNPDAVNGVGTASYRFQHDQVRQTVHHRLDNQRRARRHLRIGQLLARNLSQEELASRAVEVFNHLAYCVKLVENDQERLDYARLGLVAGRMTQRALAFETARYQLKAAADLLPEAAWAVDYETTLGIYLTLAECAHALDNTDELEAASGLILNNVKSPIDAARVHGLWIRVLSTKSRYVEAVDIGVQVAKSLGVSLPRKPRLAHVLFGVAQALWAQGRRPPSEFENLHEAADPALHAAINLLCQSASAAYFAEPNLLPLIGVTSTRLSLQHGVTPSSPYGFAVWALVLCGVLGRIENGYGFGKLALLLGRRYGGVEEARARFVVTAFVRHWKEPLAEVARLLHEDWSFNRNAGDEESAVYCAGVLLYTDFFAGRALDADLLYKDEVRYIAESDKPHVKDCFLAWAQLYEALRASEFPEELSGNWFDLAEKLPEFERTRNGVQIAISSIAAGILDHLAGRFERAERRFRTAAEWEDNIVGQVLVPGHAFFRALNIYRLYAENPKQRRLLRTARRCTARIRKWAIFAPHNLDHCVSLLDAEDSLVRGRTAEAVMALHRAADQASHGAVFYQALAERRLSEVLAGSGNTAQAKIAESRARSLFETWGSSALANKLKPGLGAIAESLAGNAAALHATSTSIEQMDLQSLLRTVGAISSEIDQDALTNRLMVTLMQTSNADRGLLLLFDSNGTAVVEADARIDAGVKRPSLPLDDFHAVARPVVDLALRTGDLVVIDDAKTNELVSNDSYVETTHVQSILAACIVLQGRTVGLIYLENHLAKCAFTPGRVEITEALGAQAGIALENARLYARVQIALKSQTAFTAANRRFVPEEILSGLGYTSIVDVDLNEAIEREMNVIFADLRSFTSLSKTLGPQRTIKMINRYLSHVQPGIAANRGFVGNYLGDGLLALFPGDADSAIHGAIAMCRGLDGYNRERGDLPALRFGIGIHSGPVTLGTIGDPDHIQCSVIGDSVNTASRIEALTKHFGATVLLSGSTYSRLANPDRLALRFLGRVEVSGRSGVIEIFECLDGLREETREKLYTGHELFDSAIDLYIKGRWSEAGAIFSECVRVCPEDQVGQVFAQRCQARANKVMHWDGIERPAKELA